MRILEVYLNGKKLCSAGVAENASMNAAVSSLNNQNLDECFCYVGASVGVDGKHAKWVDQKPLRTGDEILIRITESDFADSPVSITNSREKS